MPKRAPKDPKIETLKDASYVVRSVRDAWHDLEDGELPIHELHAFPEAEQEVLPGERSQIRTPRITFQSLTLTHQAQVEQNLKLWAKDLAEGARARNTVEALRRDLKMYVGWCRERGHIPLPATQETLVDFLDAYSKNRKATTLQRYIASVATLHKAAGLSNPAIGERVKNRLDRIKRAQALHDQEAREKGKDVRYEKRQAFGLRDEELAAADALFDLESIWELRDRALVWLAFDTLARSSEIAAMRVKDITKHPSGEWTVKIRHSKSDQYGAGQDRYISTYTADRLDAWFRAAKIKDGFIFRGIEKRRRLKGPKNSVVVPYLLKSITRQTVYRIIKDCARRMYDHGIIQFDPKHYSAHSTRVGSAQDQLAAGLGMPAVMVSGGWKTSTMVQQYASKINALEGGAAQLARQRGRVTKKKKEDE